MDIPNNVEVPSAEQTRMILIVDDNPLNQKVAKRMVEKIGFQSRCADNGEEAVSVVKREAFAAVIMDCMMPVLDGFQATKQIRQWERVEQRHVPILGLTANALQGQDMKCLAAGMDFFLTKPVTLDDLRLALDKLVDGQSNIFEFKKQRSERFQHELLDDDKLRALSQLSERGQTDFLGEIANIFIEETPAMIASLKEACDRNDFKAIHRAAQKLRGSATDMGASSMSTFCTEIMESAVLERIEGTDLRLEKIIGEYRRIRDRFRRGSPVPPRTPSVD